MATATKKTAKTTKGQPRTRLPFTITPEGLKFEFYWSAKTGPGGGADFSKPSWYVDVIVTTAAAWKKMPESKDPMFTAAITETGTVVACRLRNTRDDYYTSCEGQCKETQKDLRKFRNELFSMLEEHSAFQVQSLLLGNNGECEFVVKDEENDGAEVHMNILDW